MDSKLGKTRQIVESNKEAAQTALKTSLGEDLSKGTGSKMTEQMSKEKEKFIKKHAIKKSQSEAIEGVRLDKDQTVVSIPRKMNPSDDDDDQADVEKLEKKMRKDGSGKKRFKTK